MNEEVVISFKNVSKKFKKGRKLLLKEALLDTFKPGRTEEFYALNDISFDIKKGETVGIIGANGSGKSTILKLIAGVMVPTSGKVSAHGFIAPLIDLGAGFHPELTGRENIYLNAAILGQKKGDTEKKFDEIVKFSELEEFIDTPVKHYSSGMYVRLGFSIAVHMNPDILLVDEILAVGDSEFQKKCIDKMKEYKNSDVTIIFVSHSKENVIGFCDSAMLIQNSTLAYFGDPKECYKKYEILNK